MEARAAITSGLTVRRAGAAAPWLAAASESTTAADAPSTADDPGATPNEDEDEDEDEGEGDEAAPELPLPVEPPSSASPTPPTTTARPAPVTCAVGGARGAMTVRPRTETPLHADSAALARRTMEIDVVMAGSFTCKPLARRPAAVLAARAEHRGEIVRIGFLSWLPARIGGARPRLLDLSRLLGVRMLTMENAVNPSGWRRRSTALAKVLVIGAVAGAVAMAGGCERKRNKSSTGTGAGTGGSPSSGPIVIGHYGSMSGAQATFGQSTDNGIQLAVAERNAAGGIKGRKVVVKTLDTAGKAQEAGAAVTRLITQDHVVALLGEVASKLSIAGGEVAQHYKVPMITPSSTNEAVTQIGPMISRVCFIDGFQGYVVAKFAHDNLKAAKVAVLYDQASDYSIGLAKNFKSAFTEMGGTISTEQTYKEGDSDHAAQLATIRDSKPDAIFLPGYYTDVANIARQARKLGITVPFLGGDGWDSAKLTELGGDAIEGSYYSNHYSHEDMRVEVQTFVQAYKTKYGATPDGLAALGYDAARVLFDAMDKVSPNLDGEVLAGAIAGTTGFHGVTGLITMDQNRDARKQAVILQVQKGVPTFVTGIDPK